MFCSFMVRFNMIHCVISLDNTIELTAEKKESLIKTIIPYNRTSKNIPKYASI